jgi:hypothetical protein
MGLCRHWMNVAHVAMVYPCHLSIVPGDRNCIPTFFGDDSAICGFASPIDAGAFRKALRFVDLHCCSALCLRSRTEYGKQRVVVFPSCFAKTIVSVLCCLGHRVGDLPTTRRVTKSPERAARFEISSATFLQRSAEIRLSTILSLVDNPLCVAHLGGRRFAKMIDWRSVYTSVVA